MVKGITFQGWRLGIFNFEWHSQNKVGNIAILILWRVCENLLQLDYRLSFIGASEFFTVCTKLAEMALLYSKDLTTAKKVTSSGLDLMQEIITSPMPFLLS